MESTFWNFAYYMAVVYGEGFFFEVFSLFIRQSFEYISRMRMFYWDISRSAFIYIFRSVDFFLFIFLGCRRDTSSGSNIFCKFFFLIPCYNQNEIHYDEYVSVYNNNRIQYIHYCPMKAHMLYYVLRYCQKYIEWKMAKRKKKSFRFPSKKNVRNCVLKVTIYERTYGLFSVTEFKNVSIFSLFLCIVSIQTIHQLGTVH